MEQRKVSLGFEQPAGLEGDIIYVRLQKDGRAIRASAISNQDFTYHRKWINGTLIILGGKHTNNYSPQSRPGNGYQVFPLGTEEHKEFLDDLVKSNDAVLDYSRLIREGVEAHARIENVLKELRYFRSIV